MAAHDLTELTVGIDVGLRILLIMHDDGREVLIDDEAFHVSEHGAAIAEATRSLYIHNDLLRYAEELIDAGARLGPRDID